MMKVEGALEKILYKNDEFLIGLLRSEDESIKIVGNIFGVDKGEKLVVYGEWETHHNFGRQLKVDSWGRSLPESEKQIVSFLSSQMVKGCGKKAAHKIVEALGQDALRTIRNQGAECLSTIKGIGYKRARKISDSVKATFELQDIVSRLHWYGITANMAIKVYRIYGSDTVETLIKNPYTLTDLSLADFQKADEIARKIGILPTSSYRMKACLNHVLKNLCFETGHSFIAKNILKHHTLLALNHNAVETEFVSDDELEDVLIYAEEKYIVNDNGDIYPKYLHYHEIELARKLSSMLKRKDCRDGEALLSIDNSIKKYQKVNQIVLASNQREVIHQLFRRKLTVLTGGPGTGKTTLIRAVVDIYKAMYPEDVIRLAAPTGRASRKLTEVAGQEATTIHRLIGYRGGEPLYNRANHLSCDLLIIDEMSMVDIALANNLLQAISNETKILFVGDIDQLPSVSPGNVLHDLIESGIPTITLTEIFRQAEESQIISNAHRINQGKSLLIDRDKDDLFFIGQDSPERIAELIVRSALRFREKGYSLSDILILSPIKKGVVGTIKLNEMLRNALNPASSDKREWKIGMRIYREGDKVMQIRNKCEKDVFNGDIGIINKITKEKTEEEGLKDVLKVDFPGRQRTYEKDDLKELDLAYAITIHKSQGGEAPIVIIPTTTSHSVMLARNLLYTGMTRAREKLVFIGTEQAMNVAIQNNKIMNRNSKLATRISGNKGGGAVVSINTV